MKTALNTRQAILAAILAASLLVLPNVAAAQMNASSTDPVLPDPVPNQGVNYPPSVVTSDTAYAGPPKAVPHRDCSPLNPCALPSSEPHKLGPLVNSTD